MIRRENRGENHYFFPCGIEETKKKMLSALPVGAVLHYADKQDVAFLEQWQPERYKVQSARGDWEYLYDKEAQLELCGKKYKKMRNSINHIRSLPGWSVRPIDEQSLPLVKRLEASWEELNNDRIGSADGQPAKIALEHFKAFALTGIIAFIKDDPVGFFFGGLLDERTFFGIAQRVTDPEYCYLLRWEMYHALSSQILTINLEEDLDLEGLRQNKMLMRPDELYEMWDIIVSY